MTPTHCACCRRLLAPREAGPLCSECDSDRCRRRPHRRKVYDPASRVAWVPIGNAKPT
jgi:hypothetical protein